MQPILFCPSTSEFFLVNPDAANGLAEEVEAGPAKELYSKLRAIGWPCRARLLRAQAAPSFEMLRGVLVELIDALPILCSVKSPAVVGSELLWQGAARLALRLVVRGRLVPQLRARKRGGYEARFRTYVVDREERAEFLRLAAEFPSCTALPEEARGHAGSQAPLAGARLLQRFLDACADTLVREAARRGAVVRLRDVPAGAWEQRLVRALGEDRAALLVDPAEAESLAAEVNAWAADWATSSTGGLPLLESPGRWSAPESLAHAVRRLLRPATLLAEALLAGREAPRTLMPLLLTQAFAAPFRTSERRELRTTG